MGLVCNIKLVCNIGQVCDIGKQIIARTGLKRSILQLDKFAIR